jgi:hypothetical protein
MEILYEFHHSHLSMQYQLYQLIQSYMNHLLPLLQDLIKVEDYETCSRIKKFLEKSEKKKI